MQIFLVTNKDHYGMLWYFLEWSISRYAVTRLITLAASHLRLISTVAKFLRVARA